VSYQVTVQGHEEILHAYGALEGRYTDLRWLWELAQLKAYISELQAAHFASEGGGQWPGLADSTIKDKARKGFGGMPMLVREGALRAAMVQPWSAAGGIWEALPGEVSMGTNIEYASYINSGTEKMPHRSLWAESLYMGTADGILDITALELGVFAEALGFGVTVSKT
jgi:hypothetical protein